MQNLIDGDLTTTLSSQVNLPYAIDFRAFGGANLVTLRPKVWTSETLEVHCKGRIFFRKRIPAVDLVPKFFMQEDVADAELDQGGLDLSGWFTQDQVYPPLKQLGLLL